MGTVGEYFASLPPEQRRECDRIASVVRALLPNVEEGTSYAMPAFMHQGKPLLSVMARKKHLSIYPFSGKVVASLESELARFECTSGSIHFTEDHPIPDALVGRIVELRRDEIEGNI